MTLMTNMNNIKGVPFITIKECGRSPILHIEDHFSHFTHVRSLTFKTFFENFKLKMYNERCSRLQKYY